MIEGQLTALRARYPEDVPVLHAELYEDVATRSRADSRPWRPRAAAAGHSPYEPAAPADDAAVFSVVAAGSGELAGEALLWGIDTHNRGAHLGMSLLPGCRGRGYGTDVVRLLCHYGFTVRGLHRLQVDTLADNTAMIGAAIRAGFTLEGTLRRSAWVSGAFVDEVILGLPADEWRPAG
ncbi:MULTISPECIES: GNAT family N-acetyltransferase [unclassified Streptomyces]|uniref:GNAT family N-acetyltransferase n=1 Tax=unclassified Streptomyces TaxID=2593676 RepID=UPI00224FA772|nr:MULTISPECIES: GNAT family protein [unclassified Streptomyces]MCX4524660.1 GNAT family N-acetyltransferase [Streptomyces sp. NBC_01551]MCX4544832.1 GNAT family N-acetyltransferase [Streptomyces sp. NBC_01565]